MWRDGFRRVRDFVLCLGTVHEVSARVVTVPKQRAKEGTVRRGGRAPSVLNHKLNGGVNLMCG